MIRSGFLSIEEKNMLLRLTKSQVEKHGISRRANAILLLNDGMDIFQVAKVLYLDDDTVRQWYKCYQKDGWDALSTFSPSKRDGKLSHDQQKALIKWAETTVPGNVNHVIDFIKQKFDTYFSKSGCIKLMNRLGFEYTKPQKLSAVSDQKAQQDFIDTYEDLKKHLKDDETICFVDAVHPDHQTRPAFGWFKKDKKHGVLCTSGRKRVNIHGSIDLYNGNVCFVNTDTVNAISTLDLLKKIEAEYKDKRIIHVILDNARYHHANMLKEWLSEPGRKIKLTFLPTYCPHLNPIERLWGVMHKHVTHNKYYEKYETFRKAIISFLESVPKIWNKICDTVSDNFRIMSHDDFRVLKG